MCPGQPVFVVVNLSVSTESGPTNDRMHRLCQHLLQQGSFYPIYPTFNEQLNVEPLLAVATSREMATQRPHVLVTPSDLKHFAKVRCCNGTGPTSPFQDVDDVICINPGRLTRGQASGTLAHVTIDLKTALANQANSVVPFAKTTISRI